MEIVAVCALTFETKNENKKKEIRQIVRRYIDTGTPAMRWM